MNHGIRNDNVKRAVNERQLANISRLHRDTFRHSLSPRIFQYGFRAVPVRSWACQMSIPVALPVVSRFAAPITRKHL
jgi:hypothetical protein